jgi:hypothetical protein
MKIGIVALSFGKVSRQTDFDPINHALSGFVRGAHEDIVSWRLALQGKHTHGTEAVIVAQHEIARYLADYPGLDLRIVSEAYATQKGGGRFYLDTQDVLNEAFQVFRKENVREVIVVAHPFLHAWVARRFVKQAGFINHEFRVNRRIGFDSSRDNLQWWCRGPIRFLTYLAIQAVGKVIGKDFHGIGERHSTPM